MAIMMISMYLWSVGWPLAPQDSVHTIGFKYGTFLEIGAGIGIHVGIDVMGDSGAPIYAVADGYVKNWANSGGACYWGLAIGDEYGTDSCDGWLFWHIDSSKYHLNLGDTCVAGELIGYVVPWFHTGQPERFNHVHFCRIRSGGYPWWSCLYVQNTLSLVVPNTDTIKPEFKNAISLDKFAFCQDNSSNYLNPDSLTGDVDIIARIHDCTGMPNTWPTWDTLSPYKIEYHIYGPDTIPLIQSIEFSGLLYDSALCALTIYKNDGVCNSLGSYSSRDFYFIITNTDGDSLIELSDTLGCWQTTLYPDGTYWVVVTAYDVYGNSQSDSMQVTLQNETGIEEWSVAKQVGNSEYLHASIFQGSLQLPEGIQYKVLDITGRVVEPDKITRGIYFIEIDGMITKKVVKIK